MCLGERQASDVLGTQEYVYIQARECEELKELKMLLPWDMNMTLQG